MHFIGRLPADLLLCHGFLSKLLHQEELAHFVAISPCSATYGSIGVSRNAMLLLHHLKMSNHGTLEHWHETFCFIAKCTVLSASIELIKPLTPNPKLYSSREVVPVSPMKSQTRSASTLCCSHCQRRVTVGI